MDDTAEQPPESLLPYADWTEAALRQVVVSALSHIEAMGGDNQALPGGHHFYITFRTDHPGAVVPQRLRAQYPQEMTIVLQNSFSGLKVNQETGTFSVGLSFGGVPTTLTVPFAALTAFADPEVRFGLRFKPDLPEPAAAPEPGPDPVAEARPAEARPAEAPQVVSLDAFRRRPKE